MIYKKILIVIAIIVVAFGIYQKNNSKTLLTKIWGLSILIVQSGSMIPSLQIEEAILIKEEKEYKVDDCITYQIENKYLVTHRIIEKREEGYITKGDRNNNKDEEIVRKEQIEGKVIYHSKILGYLVKYSKWIIILLFILFLFIL